MHLEAGTGQRESVSIPGAGIWKQEPVKEATSRFPERAFGVGAGQREGVSIPGAGVWGQ